MLGRRVFIVVAIGVVIAVLGLVGLLHYHPAHVACAARHVSSCGAVRKRYLGSLALLVVGAIILIASAGEAIVRRR